mgnify:CR=1 FL=1
MTDLVLQRKLLNFIGLHGHRAIGYQTITHLLLTTILNESRR